MFSLQGNRSPWFSDVVWTGFVAAFLFCVAGGCAMLVLPARLRFDGAGTLAIPGAVAGMAFQFFYGPAHFMFDLGSRKWWGDAPWEHLVLWLIAGAGGGWLLGVKFQQGKFPEESEATFEKQNTWAFASVVCGLLGLGIGALYFLRSALPLGLFNSLSPSSAASDWLWGWGLLAASIVIIAVVKQTTRKWAVAGIALAVTLLVASYRVEANPWKSRFNSSYAQKLLSEHGESGEAIYTGNLILAQTSIDNNDIVSAKRYLLDAASTTGAHSIEQNGLDTSVARALLDRGERDAVLEYLKRGHTLWPQGEQIVSRWEATIRAGRRPNFNNRGGGPGSPQESRGTDR